MAMRYNYKSGWCRACEAQRKVQQETTNHALHLILSFLTLGAYSIVWVAIAMAAKAEWRCSECGSLRVARLVDLDESNQAPITAPDSELTEPTESAEPMEPAEPTEPTELAEPTEPKD